MLEQRRHPNARGEAHTCHDLYRDPWDTRPSDQLLVQAKAQANDLKYSATENVRLMNEWRRAEPRMLALSMPIVSTVNCNGCESTESDSGAGQFLGKAWKAASLRTSYSVEETAEIGIAAGAFTASKATPKPTGVA